MKITSDFDRDLSHRINRLPLGKTQITKFLNSFRKGSFTWDPWLFKDENNYRLFYLNGAGKKDAFWKEGTIYGALSSDLKHWTDPRVILEPNPASEWESGRMLAGSIHKEDNVYYLFYSAAGQGNIDILHEEIGLAISKDCSNWERLSPEQLFINLNERDRWYGNYLNNNGSSHFWRDPYVVKDNTDGKYYMFISAYLKGDNSGFQASPYLGCVGLAVADKINGPYEILPPVTESTYSQDLPFLEMERPQVIYKHGKYHLFFSCWTKHINPKWKSKTGWSKFTDSTLYWYSSNNIRGRFYPAGDLPIVAGSLQTSMYGTNFLCPPDQPQEIIAYGWNYRFFNLDVSLLHHRFYWNDDLTPMLAIKN